LQAALENAVIDCELDEDQDALYLTDGVEYRIWVRLRADLKLLHFCTYVTGDDDRILIPLDRVNYLNENFVLARFHGDGCRLYGDYW
jgi:hypothetical protein